MDMEHPINGYGASNKWIHIITIHYIIAIPSIKTIHEKCFLTKAKTDWNKEDDTGRVS